MKNIEENDYSEAWWSELEEVSEEQKGLNWCCKLILRSGFDTCIQNEIGNYVSLRFGVYYCPQCGKSLKKAEHSVRTNACCYLFKDLGLEGMQYEEPRRNGNGETDLVVHQLRMKYCFNCGREIDWNSCDNPHGWAGE